MTAALAPLTISPRDFRAPPPPERGIAIGSREHLDLMCRTLLDTHDPYRPALIDWPRLDDETRDKIVSLPIWDIAVATEGRASINVSSFGADIKDPLLAEAVAMDAYEERRHKVVLSNMVEAYGIKLQPEPPYPAPRDAEFAFMRTGYSECIDSFFGFGLFALAKDSGFFPEELVDTFEPVMREESRHILFFVNWVAWWRRNMPWWRRPWFEAKVLVVWCALILERIGFARGMETSGKAEDNNFTLNGSKELGVEITFSGLARLCLVENERRMSLHDKRLLRPRIVPAAIRFALRFIPNGKAAAA